MALQRLLWGSVAAIGLAACTTMDDTVDVPTGQMDGWLADKPASTHHIYAAVLTGGERNRVLNQMRSGLAAFEAGAADIAAASFDDAINRIEAIYADNPKAEKARSNFVPERAKDFKGESYERAMAFYYRGLIYLSQGDYENARAVFQGGQLQDAFAEDQRYQSDFAILDVLSGWASQCEGNDVLAREFYNRATKARPGIHIPGQNDRVLAIADMGLSPIKYGEGAYGEYLTYAESDPVPESGVNFVADGVVYPAAFGEDIYWQATTRGGRQVEAILANKAQFKDVTAGVAIASLHLADFALEVALWETWDDHHDDDHDDDDDADEALAWAAGFALVGIGSMLMSEATTPEADTRYWDNLPAHIDYASLPPGAYPTEVVFRDSSGAVIGTETPRIWNTGTGACSLAYIKSRRAADIPTMAPNARLSR